MVGDWLSTTVTVNVQVAVFPAASVAVAVTVVAPTLKVEPEAGLYDTVADPQLSVAVATKVTTLLQVPTAVLTDMFDGQVIAGAWLSNTVTVNVQVAVFPAASVAVAVTVVAPKLKVEPEAGLYDTVADPQLSEAVAANVTTAVQVPAAVLAEMFDGQVIAGAWLSSTVTVNVQVAVFPAASVAVAVTVVAPKLKVKPEAGLYDTVADPQLSVAVAAKVTTAVQVPAAVLAEMFDGQVIAGAWLSSTVTVNVQVAVFPAASVAVAVTVVAPKLKVEPEAGLYDTVADPQLSVAVAANVTTAVQVPTAVLAEMFDGQVIAGA